MRLPLTLTLLLSVVLAPLMHAQEVPYLERIKKEGEVLEYELAWYRMTGGFARMTVEPQPGDQLRLLFYAESQGVVGKVYPLRDEIESLVARETLSTLRYFKNFNQRGKVKQDLTIVDPVARVALRKGEKVAVPSPVFDPLSVIYFLRTQTLTPGRNVSFPLLADGKVYDLYAEVKGREVIDTAIGRVPAIVVEPKMSRGGLFRDVNARMIIWFSDDERRIPLRIRSEIKAGTINVSIRAVR